MFVLAATGVHHASRYDSYDSLWDSKCGMRIFGRRHGFLSGMPLGRLLGIHQPSTPEPGQPYVVQSEDSPLSAASVPFNVAVLILGTSYQGPAP